MIDNGELTPRQEAVALALACGKPTRVVARELGVSENTASRVAGEEAVKARAKELRAVMTDAAVGRLAELAVSAVDALGSVLKDPQVIPAARVQAARAVLAELIRIQGHTDAIGRIEALEAARQGGGESPFAG